MKQKHLWNNKELFAKETLFEMLSKYTKYDLESNSIKIIIVRKKTPYMYAR